MSSKPKNIVITQGDVRHVPRLSGGVDTDVAGVLSQHRLVVGFRAKSAPTDDGNFADQLVFEHLSLMHNGAVLTLYQQRMGCQIDCWRAQAVSAETLEELGSSDPTGTWAKLNFAILDLLMPANSIEDCALQFATFEQHEYETVAAYALRFRSVIKRREAAVDRASKGRIPWSAMSITLWKHGLKPSIQRFQMSEKTALPLKEVIKRVRRHDTNGLSGAATVSAT